MQPSTGLTPASLRIRGFAITGFRIFDARTPIALITSASAPEAVVVLSGEGATGKSSALTALDFFFRASVAVLAASMGSGFEGSLSVPWDMLTAVGRRDVLVRQRDRSAQAQGPTQIEVELGEQGALRLTVSPEPEGAKLTLDRGGKRLSAAESEALLAQIEQPYGPGSRPLAILSAKRRASWLPDEPHPLLLPPGMATQLYRLRTSLSAQDRQRWRVFCELLGRFEVFAGREVSIERVGAGAPQVMVEERGRLVLPFAELSWSEQQLVVLCAALLLCRAPLLCVEKPELGLDAKTQRLLFDVLDGFVRAGFVDQLIVESNSAAFSGGRVLRFGRGPRGEVLVEARAERAGGENLGYVRAVAASSEPRRSPHEGPRSNERKRESQ